MSIVLRSNSGAWAVFGGGQSGSFHVYRYRLVREWGAGKRALFCLTNPSIASHERLDPTARRCVGFARDLGYGGSEIINPWAFIATNPRELEDAQDPVGPENDEHIAAAARDAGVVIVGWGRSRFVRRHLDRLEQVLRIFRRCDQTVMALGLNDDGSPAHPLYLPRTCRPVEYRP